MNNYPAIKDYLNKFYDKLVKRYDKGDTPYNLRNCIYMDDFFKQKIIYSEIVQTPQFYLDTENYFPEATTFIMTGENLEFVIACLNSKLYNYCFKKFYSGGGLGEHGYRYKKAFIEKLPLPKITNFSILQKIKTLVILLQKTSNKDEYDNYIDQIDDILFKLADISDEEKKVINSR